MNWTCLVKITLSILSFVPLICGCGSSTINRSLSAQDQYALAMKRFNDGDYSDAVEEFQRLIFSHPGSEYLDEAIYWLGETYFRQRDYVLAAAEFQQVVRDFNDSPYADDAQLKVGLSFLRESPGPELDQKYTYLAMEAFQWFLGEYPQSELLPQVKEGLAECLDKLAEKAYKNGLLYFKMRDYEAAAIYYQIVLDDYSDTEWVDDALYGLGEINERQGNVEEALLYYREITRRHPYGLSARKALARVAELSHD